MHQMVHCSFTREVKRRENTRVFSPQRITGALDILETNEKKIMKYLSNQHIKGTKRLRILECKNQLEG